MSKCEVLAAATITKHSVADSRKFEQILCVISSILLEKRLVVAGHVNRSTAFDVCTRRCRALLCCGRRVYSSCKIDNYHLLEEVKILVKSNINDIWWYFLFMLPVKLCILFKKQMFDYLVINFDYLIINFLSNENVMLPRFALLSS